MNFVHITYCVFTSTQRSNRENHICWMYFSCNPNLTKAVKQVSTVCSDSLSTPDNDAVISSSSGFSQLLKNNSSQVENHTLSSQYMRQCVITEKRDFTVGEVILK